MAIYSEKKYLSNLQLKLYEIFNKILIKEEYYKFLNKLFLEIKIINNFYLCVFDLGII